MFPFSPHDHRHGWPVRAEPSTPRFPDNETSTMKIEELLVRRPLAVALSAVLAASFAPAVLA